MKKPTAEHRLIPAAAQFATRSTAIERPAESTRRAIATFERNLGGRAGLIEALSVARDLSPDLHRVFALIADPRYATTPLADLCADARVAPGDLFAAFAAAVRVLEETLALATAVRALPAALADVAKRTVDHEIPCEDCQGLGEIVPNATKAEPNPGPIPCPTCRGEATLKRPASLEHQRLLFEVTGLLKKAGVQVNTQINNVPASAGPLSLEQLQQSTAALLYGRRPSTSPTIEASAIDADLLDPPDATDSTDPGAPLAPEDDRHD